MQLQLQAGTILDERYRINAVLGQGGFGITYTAENIRVGMKVAIKELFWRGHCVRSEDAPPEVALANAADGPVFEEQKARFLREARTIRDFSDQAGVVGILDYFEANNTAYIVMEFVEGETLATKIAAEPLPCEALLRRFLPLIDTLDAIHRAGVIHRDISPDNIMVQPDGSLKLVDFGAARHYMNDGIRYTSISRDSYSPGEQYDKNGRQGPWTDVYALCATLYACICGAPPQGAVQRMFLDELQSPSSLGIEIDPACEAILMKGLQLRPEKRFQSMSELARAIRAALPEEKTDSGNRRGLVIGLLAGLLCAAIAVGLWAWHRYDITHKFRNVETELFRAEVAENVTASEFVAAQNALRDRLEDFAGKDNYILTVDGTSLWVTLPLACFEDREIPAILGELFTGLVPDKDVHWWYDAKANWEDPAQSMIPGDNQVTPKALKGPTVLYCFSWNHSLKTLTRGERANEMVDFKTRLDALGVPYAFGTVYGNEDKFAVRLGLERSGPLIENTLGTSYPLRIGNQISYIIDIGEEYNQQLEYVDTEDGAALFRFTTRDDGEIKKLESFTRASLENGFDKVYLADPDDMPIACANLSEPVTDGTLEFSASCLSGVPAFDEKTRWLADYFDALIFRTRLPTDMSLLGWEYIDAEGNAHLDDVRPDYRIGYTGYPDKSQALRERLNAIHEQFGYEITENLSAFSINLKLAPDDALPEQVMARLPELIEALHLDHKPVSKTLIFDFIDEKYSEGLRFVIYAGFYFNEDRIRNSYDFLYLGASIKPQYDAMVEDLIHYDWVSLGL